MRTFDACPACGGPQQVCAVEMDDKSRRRFLAYSRIKYSGLMDEWPDKMEVAIDCCPECGHHWYREHPHDDLLSAMYASSTPLLPQSDGLSRTPSIKMIREMRLLSKMMTGGCRLLDYGSGFGRWARAAVDAGFSVTAYEPTLERGREIGSPGFDTVHDIASLSGRKFDVINIEQVIEHISDPFAALVKIREFCTLDTIVRITVPNLLRCPEKRGVWNEWPYNGRTVHTMAPFEHLHGFTPRSLLCLVNRAGYDMVFSPMFFLSYPVTSFRYFFGSIFPKIGRTFLLIRPQIKTSKSKGMNDQ